MKHRHTFLRWALALIIIIMAGSLDMRAQFRRPDIYSFTTTEQERLRDLIIQWLTILPFADPLNPVQQHLDVIAPLPVGVHCKTATFLTWHRQYIGQLEAWLMGQQDGPKYVPLPKWDPTTTVPPAFFTGAVAGAYPALVDNTPSGYNFSRFNNPATICDYVAGTEDRYCMTLFGNQFFTSFGTALDNFALDLETEHNPVHGSIGGVMNSGSSPAAAIFWLWHAYVDDIYQYYLCNCTSTYPATDLYIMDNDADIGDEPNLTAGVYFLSPEIWVRKNADTYDPVTESYSLENDVNRHQNAEYKIIGDNYVYVRVRNKGCNATTATNVRLRVYWSKAQTSGWIWPNDWTNTPPIVPKRGDEITDPGVPLYVPALQPGETWVAEVPWHAPDPADYPDDSYHFCLLARLESALDPMAQPEGTDVNYNTKENNNIAWKNVTVRNDDPFNLISAELHPWNTVHVRATPRLALDTRLVFNFPANHGVLATIDLRGNLYTRWVAGGRVGKSVTPIGGNYLRIDAPGAYIGGLQLSPNEIYTLGVRAYVEYGKDYQGKVLDYGERVNVNVTQSEKYESNGQYVVAGGNNYELRLRKSDETSCGKFIRDQYTIVRPNCPNGNSGSITLHLPSTYDYFWSTGGRGASIQNIPPGTYWVVVRTDRNCVERREFVVDDVSGLATTITSHQPHCRYNNGDATVHAAGGNPPYTYQWYLNGQLIQGATNATLLNMGFGNYTVVVTGNGGCTITDGVTFTDDFMQMGLNFKVTDASAPGVNDGSINLTVLDGMAPYTYQWSNGKTIEDPKNLLPGEYSVTVIDAMGCVASGTAVVGVNPQGGNLQSVDRENGDLSVLSLVPNPTTDLAEVQYTLRYVSNVRVEIYDELGKRVASYDQGSKMPGVNSAWLDTRSLPSGRYACRLVYKGGISSVPFVVVR